MTAAEYTGALSQCYMVAQVLLQLPLREMLAAIYQAETVGPFADPTLYSRKHEAMERDQRVLLALRRAQEQLQKHAADMAEIQR